MPMMSEFRRSVVHDSKHKGGGGGGSWREQFRMPKDIPTPFVLINAEYTDPAPAEDELERDPTTGQFKPVKKPYSKGKKHKRKVGPNAIFDDECSAGWDPHNPRPCVGCFYQDSGDRQFTTSEVFRIGIVHLVPYHGHPILDTRVQPNTWMTKKDNPNEFVLAYDPCEGRTCNYCRVAQGIPPIQNDPKKQFPMYPQNSITIKFGHRRYLELGKGHLGDLVGWDQAISANCGTLTPQGRCNAPLTTLSFNCPQCRNVVIDMRTDTRTDQQIIEAVSGLYPCMTCQRGQRLVEVLDCEVCRANNRQFTQNTLFAGMVLWGCRQGEGTKSKLFLQRYETLDEFQAHIHPNFLQGKTLKQLVEEIGQRYDFDAVIKPRDLAGQAQRYQVAMPPQLQQFAQSQQAQQFQGGPAPQSMQQYQPSGPQVLSPAFATGQQVPPQGYQPQYGAPPPQPMPMPQAQPPGQPFVPYGGQPGMPPQQMPQQPMMPAPMQPGAQPGFVPQPQFQPNSQPPGPVGFPQRPDFSQ